MNANTTHKDSVFSLLFSDPDLLRELYSALEGVTLPPDVPVTINTLKNALFINRVNDISFEIGDKLVILIEHQSTINPNMALRLLMYIARVYEKIIGKRNIYTTNLIRIPRPEFFVLYNGTEPYADEKTLKLSEAFETAASLGLPEKESPALELVVKVININHGKNEALVKRCKTLTEYSAFIAKVREYEKAAADRTEAMTLAVRYCQEHDILKKFLEKHGTEVINMLFAEWDQEDALAVRYEEGMARGIEQGIERGIEQGIERGIEQGIERGIEQGIGRGIEQGIEQGLEKTARNALAKGLAPELIHSITGLDLETIKNL